MHATGNGGIDEGISCTNMWVSEKGIRVWCWLVLIDW